MANQTVLITGASSGIGTELARSYAGKNTNLFLAGRDIDRLEAVAQLCRENGATVFTEVFDIKNRNSCLNWINSAEEVAPIDILIANAGLMEIIGADEFQEPAEKTLSQIDTNLTGCVNVVAAAVPHFVKRKCGQIVLIASMAGLQPIGDAPGYSASKAGLVAFGESIYAYLKKYKINVSIICPGYISTPMSNPHQHPRILEMSAEQAAKKIRTAISKKKAFYAFPFLLFILIKLGRYLPIEVRRFTTAKFNFLPEKYRKNN